MDCVRSCEWTRFKNNTLGACINSRLQLDDSMVIYGVNDMHSESSSDSSVCASIADGVEVKIFTGDVIFLDELAKTGLAQTRNAAST